MMVIHLYECNIYVNQNQKKASKILLTAVYNVIKYWNFS